MRLKSSSGEREVAASAFFQGLLTTDVAPDEMLVDIEYPKPQSRSGACFMEVARRRGDFAIAGVAAIVTLDVGDACAGVRLALCGVGETPVDASEAVTFLVGQPCADAPLKAAAAAVEAVVDPSGNVHATADYQKHLAGVLTQRALRTAYQRALHAA